MSASESSEVKNNTGQEAQPKKHWEPDASNPMERIQQEKSLLAKLRDLKSRRVSLKTLMRATVAAAGLTATAKVLIDQRTGDTFDVEGGRGDQSNENVATIEAQTPKGEWTQVPGTNVVVPTITSDRVETVTPQPREVEIMVDPALAEDPEEADWIEQKKAEIDVIVAQVPNVGPLQFRLESQHYSHYYWEENVIGVGKSENVTELESLQHETGHYLDIALNKQIAANISSEKMQAAKVARAEMIENFYADFTVDKLLSDEKVDAITKLRNGEELTADELAEVAKIRATTRYFSEIPYEISSQVGADQVYFGGARETFSNWQDVVSKKSAELDELAAMNQTMSVLVADLRNRPEFYDRYFAIYFSGENNGEISASGFNSAFGALAKAMYLNLMIKGEVKDLGNKFASFRMLEDLEVVAEIVGTHLANGQDNAYLVALR